MRRLSEKFDFEMSSRGAERRSNLKTGIATLSLAMDISQPSLRGMK